MEWLTSNEAAAYLKIKPRTLAAWVNTGKVPGHRLSGTRRYVWRFLELGRAMQLRQPECIKILSNEPDLSPAFEYGWRASHATKEFISTKELADKCLLQFMDLIQRDRAGKVRRDSPYY
jgi:excisionase family DNA binding protein